MIFKLKMKNVQHMGSMLGMRWSDENTTVIISVFHIDEYNHYPCTYQQVQKFFAL